MKFNKFKIFFILVLLIGLFVSVRAIIFKQKHKRKSYIDAVLVGPINASGNIGPQASYLINTIKKTGTIKFIPNRSLEKISTWIKDIVPYKKLEKQRIWIALYEADSFNETRINTFLPKHSYIKILYSNVFATEIPKTWIFMINQRFDAVIVPDKFLASVYKGSGVAKPIFILPPCINLEDFIHQPIKQIPNKPFVIGNITSISNKNNALVLLEAFFKTFGNSKDVKLILNKGNLKKSLSNKNNIVKSVLQKIQDLGLENVKVLEFSLNDSDEYIKQLSSFDCYVSPSKIIGFPEDSLKALAMGIPTILTDNTAQSTFCESGHFQIVPSDILEPDFDKKVNCFKGYAFNCNVEDIALELKNIYQNYGTLLKKAPEGRKWASQYQDKKLLEKYVTLLNPSYIKLGKNDHLTSDGCLETTSKELYLKYLHFLDQTLSKKNVSK